MNRHSLFWKIFLSFWVFMVLFGMSNVVINAQLNQPVLGKPDMPVFKILMRTRRMLFQGATAEDLSDWLKQIQQHLSHDRVYIINPQGHELLGRTLSPALQQSLLDKPATPLGFRPDFRPPRPPGANGPGEPPQPIGIIIKKLPLLSGETYKLIIDNQETQARWQLLRSLSLGVRITIASLLSGIICFFLARYLTSPLQKLRASTHQVASGDFNSPIDSAITQRKDEIGDLGRDFEHMTKRIGNTLLSQQRLLRDVSHELRSPLARLQIALGLAQQRSNGLINPELARIEQEIERLNELISQSLSLARLSSQTDIQDKTSINLNELFECVIANAEYEANNKNCHIILTQLDHCMIAANWDLLHSALENILRNAVHYTKTGTTIDTSIARLNKAATPTVNIKIRDHGMGVPSADLDKLFTPFFRVDEARTQQSGGYGIGLAIAERAIDLHKGDIVVTNAAGGGLEINIQLPLIESFGLPI